MRVAGLALFLWISSALAGCGREAESDHGHSPATTEEAAAEPWSFTAWGSRFEIFAECDPLEVGRASKSHTHVTILESFAPLREGAVSAILRDAEGGEERFRQPRALRDGIFSIEIKPAREGTFALFFLVEAGEVSEEIASGRVRVGSASRHGGIDALPEPGVSGAVPLPASGSDEPVAFLKEQQWRTPFTTAWVVETSLPRTVHGPAQVSSPPAGEQVLTAPIDGSVVFVQTVHVGRSVRAGETLFALSPRVSADRSARQIASELTLTRGRLERLERLLELGAVSQTEVEAVRSKAEILESERRALERETSPEDEKIQVRAARAGVIAELWVEAGGAVTAGEPLVRIVQSSPVWLEVSLTPEEAARLESNVVGAFLRRPGSGTALEFRQDEIRLISRSPAIERSTGRLRVFFELQTDVERLPLGSSLDAQLLLAESTTGASVPFTALVDDAGTSVVYVQTEGESFVRREVRVEAELGDVAVTAGLVPGTRIVTVGGAAIRRASLLSSGAPEGHVH